MEKDIIYVDVESLIPNVYQPRKTFNDESIDELSKSISAYGIIQPISVRKIMENTYEIVAGERRYRAAKRAGLANVPVIVVDITDTQSAAIALLENIQREDLNFLEEAEAYDNLIKEHNYTQKELAEKIGKKQSTIANKLRLLKLPSEIRILILKGNLTERHSRALLKLPNKELQLKILNSVIEKKLNVSNTENLINKELLKFDGSGVSKDGKKRIKGIFSASIYINTIKQVFDKFGIEAKYKSKENEENIEVTIIIPKKK
ncbi:nucleoid occlusion protein [Clostridium sp. DL1XJH146]